MTDGRVLKGKVQPLNDSYVVTMKEGSLVVAKKDVISLEADKPTVEPTTKPK